MRSGRWRRFEGTARTGRDGTARAEPNATGGVGIGRIARASAAEAGEMREFHASQGGPHAARVVSVPGDQRSGGTRGISADQRSHAGGAEHGSVFGVHGVFFAAGVVQPVGAGGGAGGDVSAAERSEAVRFRGRSIEWIYRKHNG